MSFLWELRHSVDTDLILKHHLHQILHQVVNFPYLLLYQSRSEAGNYVRPVLCNSWRCKWLNVCEIPMELPQDWSTNCKLSSSLEQLFDAERVENRPLHHQKTYIVKVPPVPRNADDEQNEYKTCEYPRRRTRTMNTEKETNANGTKQLQRQ